MSDSIKIKIKKISDLQNLTDRFLKTAEKHALSLKDKYIGDKYHYYLDGLRKEKVILDYHSTLSDYILLDDGSKLIVVWDYDRDPTTGSLVEPK